MKIYGQLDLYPDKSAPEKTYSWKVCVEDDHNIESVVEYDNLEENIPHSSNECIIRHLKTNGLLVIDYRFTNNMDTLMKIGIAEDCILMEFLLNGDTEPNDVTKTNIQNKNIIGKHNLQYLHHDYRLFYLHSDIPFDAFCILMSKEFYFNIIEKTNSLHDDFAEHIKSGIRAELSEHYLPINFEMQSVIHKIRNCSRTGSLHRFCLEIKIQELLLLQFEQYHAMSKDENPKNSLYDRDIESIQTAAKLLEDTYNMPPTIKNLAKIVGINENKLKKRFKELYQMTIHEYVIKLRMDKATKMIKEQHFQMKEVAMELGYRNPSHFSAAFKRHFGFLPTEMVRNHI